MDSKSATDVVKVIRTLLTSAKNGLLTNEINDDYKQMENKEIPFKAFGYNSLEDFLRDTNQFTLFETKQGIKVMSKPSKDAYVQRSTPNSPSKSKKKVTDMVPPQRALRPTTDNHWNGTAYSQAYTQMPNRSVKKAFTHPAKLLQAAYTNGGAYRPILKQSNIKQVPKDEHFTVDEATNWTQPNVQSRPFPMRIQQNINNQQNSGASNLWNQRNPHDRASKKPQDVKTTKSSVQSRLAIQKTISNDTVDFVQSQQPTYEQQQEDTSFNYSNGGITQKVRQ